MTNKSSGRGSLLRRLLAKISPEPNSGCWLWTGAISNKGYGVIHTEGANSIGLAHRISYEFHVGLIPDGLILDHKCRVPLCVNPDHLEPVTQAVNVQRGGIAEVNRRRGESMTHCRRGHERSPENTFTDAAGASQCRECGRRRCREYYWRRKAAE